MVRLLASVENRIGQPVHRQYPINKRHTEKPKQSPVAPLCIPRDCLSKTKILLIEQPSPKRHSTKRKTNHRPTSSHVVAIWAFSALPCPARKLAERYFPPVTSFFNTPAICTFFNTEVPLAKASSVCVVSIVSGLRLTRYLRAVDISPCTGTQTDAALVLAAAVAHQIKVAQSGVSHRVASKLSPLLSASIKQSQEASVW